MAANPQAVDPGEGPDPFRYPADTDFRFALLIAVVFAASLFIFRWLYQGSRLGAERYAQAIETCFGAQGPSLDPGLAGLLSTNQAVQACMAPINQRIGLWMVAGTLALFAAALFFYLLHPTLIIRRGGYQPLTEQDAPETVGYLRTLLQQHQVGVEPRFLWNPLDPSLGGLAFGRWRRYCVAMTGGLVTTFFTDRAKFDTVLLHELSHLRNRDVNKTYWSVAVWRAFLLVALLPLALDLLTNPFREVLQVGWRVAALALLVYLVRNSVLRARELFADARMARWFGDRSELAATFAAMLGADRKRAPTPLATHPPPSRRLETLSAPARLLRFSPWDAAVAGLGAALIFASVHTLLGSLSYGMGLPLLPAIGAGLLVGALAVGIIGLGLWRATHASLAGAAPTVGAGRLGLAFGFGLTLARPLALEYLVEPYLQQRDLATTLARAGFGLLWALLVLLALALFFRWLAAGALAWTRGRPSGRAPGLALPIGLLLATVVLAGWLGPALWVRGYDASIEEMALAGLTTLLALPTVVPLHPLTHFILFFLWAYPLAGLIHQRGLLPALAGPAKLSLAAVVAFALIVLLSRLALRLGVDPATRESESFKLLLYAGHLVLAFGLQAILVVITAVRSGEQPVSRALAAAFLAAAGMTAAMLLLLVLFGGSPDLPFIWQTFSHLTIGAGAVALVLGLAVGGLRTLGGQRQPLAAST